MQSPNEDETSYLNDGHVLDTFRKMAELRENELFCDVCLVVEGVKISVHKIILSSCSDYFKCMFTTRFKEKNQNTIPLQDIKADTAKALINYMYTSKIEISEDNVEELLMGSTMWLLNGVAAECCTFLENSLDIRKCIKFWDIAISIGHRQMQAKAEKFIDRHFEEIKDSDEFMNLKSQQVVNILSRNTLVVTSEEIVYECVMSWLNRDLDERSQYLGDLISCIRMPLLSKEYVMDHIMNNQIILDNNICKENMIMSFLCKTPVKRKSTYYKQILLVVGGQDSQAQGTLEYYDFKTNTWHNLKTIHGKLTSATIIEVNEKMYVVGESKINSFSYGAFGEYNIADNTWNNCVTTEESSAHVAYLENCIYFIGNFNNLGCSNAVKKFDLKTRKRTSVAPMSTARSHVSVGVMNNLLYVVGGYNFLSGPLETAECYNPRTNTWKQLPNMKHPRTGAGICAFGGLLYIVGGHSGKDTLKSVLTFDPKTCRWEEIPSMQISRNRPAVVVCNNLLYVIGGSTYIANTYDYRQNNASHCSELKSVEVYNPKNKTWATLTSQMNAARSAHGAAVVYKPK